MILYIMQSPKKYYNYFLIVKTISVTIIKAAHASPT